MIVVAGEHLVEAKGCMVVGFEVAGNFRVGARFCVRVGFMEGLDAAVVAAFVITSLRGGAGGMGDMALYSGVAPDCCWTKALRSERATFSLVAHTGRFLAPGSA